MVTDELMELAIQEYADQYHDGDWKQVPVPVVRGIVIGIDLARRRWRCNAG